MLKYHAVGHSIRILMAVLRFVGMVEEMMITSGRNLEIGHFYRVSLDTGFKNIQSLNYLSVSIWDGDTQM
jgi:hypothetical protein